MAATTTQLRLTGSLVQTALAVLLGLCAVAVTVAAAAASTQPRCASLAPKTCSPVFLEKNGKIDYTAKSYGASCRNDKNELTHRCAVPTKSSFCNVKYAARLQVDANDEATGEAEDEYAKCMSGNLGGVLALYNCRDVQHWTCDNCTDAYKEWVCASTFPRCTAADASPEKDIVKPCRGVCHQVMRRCPKYLQFKCPPDGDDRDYVPCLSSGKQPDSSNCNAMNLDVFDACDVAR